MLVELMKERYTPNSNKVRNHYLFHRIAQQSNETFDDFVYRVKAEAEHCDFKFINEECTVKDILIRDQILVGTNNETRTHVNMNINLKEAMLIEQ